MTKQIRKIRWMRAFEAAVLVARPEFAGQIDWADADHFYNIGQSAADAAAKYCASRAPRLDGGLAREVSNSHPSPAASYATSTTKIAIILVGGGGELDRKEIEIRSDQDESAVIGNSVVAAVDEWTLSPGDTIHIRAMEGV
jgi:hypothetical protein